MAKPLITKFGKHYRLLQSKLCILDLTINEIKEERERVLNGCQQTNGLKGIDYSKEKVSCSNITLSFGEAMMMYDGLTENINRLEQERNKIDKEIKSFRKKYKPGKKSSDENDVFYYREIIGLSQTVTSKRMGCSVRNVQRIEKKIKERQFNMSDSDT